MLADYLVEFTVVARMGSISRASSELSLSRSALSRHMTALEARLGCKLMERGGGSMELTEAGRAVASRAGDMVDILDDVCKLAAVFRSDDVHARA